jgi:flavin-dependent dehydrogenase
VVRRQAPRRLHGARFCLIGDAAGLARDMSGEGIGPAIRSGRLAAEAVAGLIRLGTPLDGYRRQIVERYGAGELGWLSRKLSSLPDSLARLGVRVIIGSATARRRIVFDSIFGMREVAS